MKSETGRAWPEAVALAFIILVALVVRLGWVGLTEFKADEARLFSAALETAGGRFAVRGISSSVGFPNFPMSVWLYALPLAIRPHPYAATLFTGLLSVAALAGAYWLARRYWGRTAALLAALLFAVSPWAILFSRKIWAQNLLPPFLVLWAISAALAFVEARRGWIVWHFLALAVAVELHLSAVALVPATALFLLVFRRRVDWRYALVGLAAAALTALPFLWYLWGERQQAGQLGLPALSGRFSPAALRYAVMLNLGADLQSLAGPAAVERFLEQAPNLAFVRWFWGLLIVGGAILLVYRLARRWEEPASQTGLIFLAWLMFPVLFFTFRVTPVYLHYFIGTFPAAYLIAGVFVSAALSSLSRPGRVAGWAILAASAAAQLWLWASLMLFVGRVATPGGFGAPLAMKLTAVESARALWREGRAAEILVAAPGVSPRVDEAPAEYEALLYDVPHRFVDVTREAVFPAQGAVVLVDPREAPERTTADLYQSAGTLIRSVPLREGEGRIEVLSLPGGGAPTPAITLDNPPLLANFARLWGFDGPRPLGGGRALWQVHWQTADEPVQADYHFFNHLLDDQGQQLGQADGPAFAPAQWRAGDMVVSRFLLPWPDREAALRAVRVGMYAYPSLSPVYVLDEAANPAGDSFVVMLTGE